MPQVAFHEPISTFQANTKVETREYTSISTDKIYIICDYTMVNRLFGHGKY